MHWRSFAAQLTLNSELFENTAINSGFRASNRILWSVADYLRKKRDETHTSRSKLPEKPGRFSGLLCPGGASFGAAFATCLWSRLPLVFRYHLTAKRLASANLGWICSPLA
jgi:hypothetical protein